MLDVAGQQMMGAVVTSHLADLAVIVRERAIKRMVRVTNGPNRRPQRRRPDTINRSKTILNKGTLMHLPRPLYSIIFLLYSWGSLFGVSSRVPLLKHLILCPPSNNNSSEVNSKHLEETDKTQQDHIGIMLG